MKTSATALLFLMLSSEAFSGGSVGGNPPAFQEMDALSLMRFSVDQLPKVYASPEAFRRVNLRLGVAGVETAHLMTDGGNIQARKLGDSLVDERVLKHILPVQ